MLIKDSVWSNLLVTLVFVVAPAFISYVFLLPAWSDTTYPFYIYLIWALGFPIYVGLVLWLFIYLQVIMLHNLTINLPLAFVFSMFLLTHDLHLAVQIVLTLSMIFTTIPMLMLVAKIRANTTYK